MQLPVRLGVIREVLSRRNSAAAPAKGAAADALPPQQTDPLLKKYQTMLEEVMELYRGVTYRDLRLDNNSQVTFHLTTHHVIDIVDRKIRKPYIACEQIFPGLSVDSQIFPLGDQTPTVELTEAWIRDYLYAKGLRPKKPPRNEQMRVGVTVSASEPVLGS